MTFILNPASIAESKSLGLPSALLARWNQCLQNNNPLCWRALSTWMRAETTISELDNKFADAARTRLLADVAKQHYRELMPLELEAAA
jgi:hypothetical protein